MIYVLPHENINHLFIQFIKSGEGDFILKSLNAITNNDSSSNAFKLFLPVYFAIFLQKERTEIIKEYLSSQHLAVHNARALHTAGEYLDASYLKNPEIFQEVLSYLTRAKEEGEYLSPEYGSKIFNDLLLESIAQRNLRSCETVIDLSFTYRIGDGAVITVLNSELIARFVIFSIQESHSEGFIKDSTSVILQYYNKGNDKIPFIGSLGRELAKIESLHFEEIIKICNRLDSQIVPYDHKLLLMRIYLITLKYSYPERFQNIFSNAFSFPELLSLCFLTKYHADTDLIPLRPLPNQKIIWK